MLSDDSLQSLAAVMPLYERQLVTIGDNVQHESQGLKILFPKTGMLSQYCTDKG